MRLIPVNLIEAQNQVKPLASYLPSPFTAKPSSAGAVGAPRRLTKGK
jgi:hypothetical protein